MARILKTMKGGTTLKCTTCAFTKTFHFCSIIIGPLPSIDPKWKLAIGGVQVVFGKESSIHDLSLLNIISLQRGARGQIMFHTHFGLLL